MTLWSGTILANPMLPSFPAFRGLTFADKGLISEINGRFPPYSDFNFTSLWCWNIFDQIRISDLDGNLVVRFTDYLDGQSFYSLVGTAVTAGTLWDVLALAHQEGVIPILKLIPAESLSGVCADGLQICEDPDNFDYMLSIREMSSFPGHSFRRKRYYANRFSRQYRATTREIDLANTSIRPEVEKLLIRWAFRKRLSDKETHNEFTAISRLFACVGGSEFLTVGIFDQDRLIGFSVSELLERGVALMHVEKADTEYVGIYPYLMQQTALRLAATGQNCLNYEQDLGVAGFRHSKLSFRPCAVLKKSRVSPRGIPNAREA